MSYKIVILASAEQDVKELRSYIVKNFSPATWQDTYSKLKDVICNNRDQLLFGEFRDTAIQYFQLTGHRILPVCRPGNPEIISV